MFSRSPSWYTDSIAQISRDYKPFFALYIIYFPARAEEYTILYILFFKKIRGCTPLPCGDAGDNHYYKPHEQSDGRDSRNQPSPDNDRKEAEPQSTRENTTGMEDNEGNRGEEAESAKSDATRSSGSLYGFVHCCYLLCFS